MLISLHIWQQLCRKRLRLSKRGWGCFTRAASSPPEYTRHKLIYWHSNNAWSYCRGIGSCLSLLSNKPVTATTTKKASFLRRGRNHGDRENNGSTKPAKNVLLTGEAMLILNHPPPPRQVFAALLAEEISKEALKRDVCSCLQRGEQRGKTRQLVWKRAPAGLGLRTNLCLRAQVGVRC